MMTPDEATRMYEDVLDTLIEVGNGTTEADLNEALLLLTKLRDEHFRPLGALRYS